MQVENHTTSTSRPRRTKREQREESIDKLLLEARALFVSKGYRATTLEQIAVAAGLTKGSLYFHFGSKEAVLVKLLDKVEAEIIFPAINILKSAQGSVSEKLVQFMRLHGEMGITKREDLLLLISMSIEFAQQTGDAAAQLKKMYQALYKPLEALLRRGQMSGEVRKDAPATELASIIVATHDGAFLEWYRRGNQLDGRNLVRATLSVLLHGL
jgi:AcrR family transcriptional regulator